MKEMKHWSKSLALLALVLGIAGEGTAIAIGPTKSPAHLAQQSSQFNISTSQTSLQIAQLSDSARSGECHAVRRETPIYRDNSIRAITGLYLNVNDIVYLQEDNRRGKRLIAVYIPQINFSGYVETSELKLCPPIVGPSSTPSLPTSTFPPPSLPTSTFPSPRLDRCEIIRATNLYESPGFGSQRRDFLELGERVEIDPQRNATANNFQWLYITTELGDSGWLIVDSVGCR
ncbi:MAG: hypothetical protein AB4290_13330 [Spirulina sp.]